MHVCALICLHALIYACCVYIHPTNPYIISSCVDRSHSNKSVYLSANLLHFPLENKLSFITLYLTMTQQLNSDSTKLKCTSQRDVGAVLWFSRTSVASRQLTACQFHKMFSKFKANHWNFIDRKANVAFWWSALLTVQRKVQLHQGMALHVN